MDHGSDKLSAAAWIEVRISAPGAQAEAAADFLYGLSGLGVRLDGSGLAGVPVEVVGYLVAGPEAPAQRAQVERYARSLAETCSQGQVSLAFGQLADEDWHKNWKRYFHPQEVVAGLVVGPSWEPVDKEPGQMEVVIDPGQAFGTGQHETTVLCLGRLMRLARAQALNGPVLDVGCGTGILAITALLLGAPRALGIDLDPLAVAASAQNAEHNQVSGRLELSTEALQNLTQSYPVVLANITAADLIALAPYLAARLSPGGEIIASGMLHQQSAGVQAAFEGLGLKLVECKVMGAWASLVMS